MFNSKLKATFVAAAIAVGTLLTANAPASAEVRGGAYIGGPNFQIGISSGGRYKRGGRYYRGDRWERKNRCRPGRALRKARKKGLRRAYVARVGQRGVVIKGRKRGDRVVMGFDRSRKCRIRYVRAR